MAKSIEEQLLVIAKNTKLSNGKTIKQNLESAVKYLYKCLDYQISEYYASYSPIVYARTFKFKDSLYAEDFLQARVEGNKIKLSVSFKDSMAYHNNLFGTHKSYVPILVNFGWVAPKLAKKMGGHIEFFTFYEGYHMVENAVREFNATNRYGVHISEDDVSALWNGKSDNITWDW